MPKAFSPHDKSHYRRRHPIEKTDFTEKSSFSHSLSLQRKVAKSSQILRICLLHCSQEPKLERSSNGDGYTIGYNKKTLTPETSEMSNLMTSINGGQYRIRTCDLFHVKETRYQLRQLPTRQATNTRQVLIVT